MENLDMDKIKETEMKNMGMSEEESKKFQVMLKSLGETTREIVKKEFEELKDEQDERILAERGVRRLTSEEVKFYNKFSETPNMKNALDDLDLFMPETIINAIFDDLTGTHPLLSHIRFQNMTALTTMYLNTNQKQLASWKPLNTSITEELESSFKKISFSENKLSAWIPVHNDMLALGPNWIDRYVRILLEEAIAYALEEAIINGTGNGEPIGMIRQVGDDVTITGGVYPKKEALTLTSLDPKTYGDMISNLCQTPNGHYRTVSSVIMIVNPIDNLTILRPATTQKLLTGGYATDLFPFPTTVIESEQMERGKAVIGLGDRYFMGVGAGKSGKIEYSDEYKFLEDMRTYKTKMYGNGTPMDNNAFIYCDISGLEADLPIVKTKTAS